MKPPQRLPEPPRSLGEHGFSLWRNVQDEFCIEDAAGVEILMQACAALDLAEALGARIEADGLTLKTAHGIKSHPAIRDQLQARALVVRTLQRLGIADQPIKPMGKPSRVSSWKGFDDDADE